MGAKNVCVITDKKASWWLKSLVTLNLNDKLIFSLFGLLVKSIATSVSSSGFFINSWS